MTTADQHRANAEQLLDSIPGAHSNDSLPLAAEATAHALLAIEARLGELVEQQRIGNTIAAFAHPHGALSTPEEFRAARAAVRDALGLPMEDQD